MEHYRTITLILALLMSIGLVSGVDLKVDVGYDEDDAEQVVGSNCVRTSSDIELGRDASNQHAIFMFNNVAVPQGATINNAYLELKAIETSTQAGAINIYGDDTDDSERPDTATQCISSRTWTTATINYDPVDWTIDEWYNTTDIKTIVQEIVTRPGWASGNNMSVIFENMTVKLRNVYSHDNGDGSNSANLYINYTAAAGGPWEIPSLNSCLYNHTNDSFTVVVLPDTQEFTDLYPQMFYNQTWWIDNHSEDYNISYTVHVGDVVDSHSPTTQYDIANTSLSKLYDNNIPFSIQRGNHDASHSTFNNYFPVSRHAYNPGYIDNYNDNDQSYHEFNVSGLEFGIIAISWETFADELDWVNQTLANNTDKRMIVSSHQTIDHSGGKFFDGQGVNVSELLYDYNHTFLYVGGHSDAQVAMWNVSKGQNLTTVNYNYQYEVNAGSGKMVLFNFYPSANNVAVRVYSPYSDSCDTSDDYNFTYNMSLSGQPGPDVTAPKITNLLFTDVITTRERVTFNTDEPLGANRTINYGNTTALGTLSEYSSYTNNHNQLLTGLLPNTTYYVNITVCDGSANCATNGTFNFTTAAPGSGSPATPNLIPGLVGFIIAIIAVSLMGLIYQTVEGDGWKNNPGALILLSVVVITVLIGIVVIASTL